MHNTSSIQRGRAMSAKFLRSRVIVMIVLMVFLAAGEASDGNFMPTFFSLRDYSRRIIDTGQQCAMQVLPGCCGSLPAVRRSQQARFAVG